MYKFASIDLAKHQPGLASCLTKAFEQAGLKFVTFKNSAMLFLPPDPEQLNKMLQNIRRMIKKVDGVAAQVEFQGVKPPANHGPTKDNGVGRLVQLIKG